MKLIETIEQCQELLDILKSKGYVILGSGQPFGDDSYYISYINDYDKVEIKTRNKDVFNYFIKYGGWRS